MKKTERQETLTGNLATSPGRNTDFSPIAWAVNGLFLVKASLSAERLVRYENIRVQAKEEKHKASNKSGSCLSCI